MIFIAIEEKVAACPARQERGEKSANKRRAQKSQGRKGVPLIRPGKSLLTAQERRRGADDKGTISRGGGH